MISAAWSLRHAGDLLQLALLLGARCLGLFDHLAVVSLPVGDRLLPPGQVFLHVVQTLFPAQQAVLQLGQLLAALLYLRFNLSAQLVHLILKLNSSFPLSRLSLPVRILDDALRGLFGRMYLGLPHVFASQEPADHTDDRHHEDYYDPQDCHHLDITIPLPHALSRLPKPGVREPHGGIKKAELPSGR